MKFKSMSQNEISYKFKLVLYEYVYADLNDY